MSRPFENFKGFMKNYCEWLGLLQLLNETLHSLNNVVGAVQAHLEDTARFCTLFLLLRK
jgi:hypothetical protein